MGSRRLSIAVVIGGAVTGSCGKSPSPLTLAIANVNIVDVTAGIVRPRATVIVRGTHITNIEWNGTPAPRHAHVVDGAGRFLIPGMWDMHVHLSAATEASLPLLIANGVVGVRDMGSDLAEIQRWRRDIESGRLVGPRIVTAGPKLDGDGGSVAYFRIVRSPEEARSTVDELAAAGVDFIKVHAALDRPRLLAIAEQSRADGLSFAGHLPDDVTPSDAAQMGIRSIEHFSGFSRPCSDDLRRLLKRVEWNDVRKRCAAESDLDATLAVLHGAGTWVTPTLVSFERLSEVLDPNGYSDPHSRYVVPALRYSWEVSARAIVADVKPSRDSAPVWRHVLETYGPLTGRAQRDHVKLLAGTDVGNPLVSPGFDLHEELVLMVRAGLTPAQALSSATAGPATFLGKTADFGIVAQGQRADLVLLDGNPLDDIRNTQRVRAVIVNGRFFDRAALDALLTAAASAASLQQ
jgi:imidazolonepropionase-like amidohydrolase